MYEFSLLLFINFLQPKAIYFFGKIVGFSQCYRINLGKLVENIYSNTLKIFRKVSGRNPDAKRPRFIYIFKENSVNLQCMYHKY